MSVSLGYNLKGWYRRRCLSWSNAPHCSGFATCSPCGFLPELWKVREISVEITAWRTLYASPKVKLQRLPVINLELSTIITEVAFRFNKR